VVEKITVDDFHRIMGHISLEGAERMLKEGMVDGVVKKEGPKSFCKSCAHAKTTRKAISKERSTPKSKARGEIIHSDLWGPAQVQTPSHNHYYISFTDDYSRYSTLYLLKTKDEAFEAYKKYEKLLEMQFRVKIKCLHSDRGGEYLSGAFTAHLEAAGKTRILTVHDTPEHNGVAERLN
jgi:transposase InsO family protein